MAKKYDDSNGVWRTIGGRRVFIKNGQSLSDAMKESGKFKGAKKQETEEEKRKKMNETMDKRASIINKLDEDTKDLEDYDKYNLAVSKLEQSEGMQPTERQYWVGVKERYEKQEKAREELIDRAHNKETKRMLNAKSTSPQEAVEKYNKEQAKLKEENDKILKMNDKEKEKKQTLEEIQENIRKNTPNEVRERVEKRDKEFNEEEYDKKFRGLSDYGKEQKASKLTDRDAQDLLKELNDEGSDFTFDEDVKIEDGKIKTSVGMFMPDERGYTTRDLEIPVDENETYASLETKMRDWQYQHSTPDSFENPDFKQTTNEYMNDKIKDMYKKDNLPHKTEIKTQGTSNRKEVSENIQAHILDYYDKPEDFIEQMDAMSYLPTNWKRGEELAKGGSYLIYNQDMADFLNELKINPKGKSFSEDKSFDMYTSLIGRESAKLYDRLKRNAYKEYLKEHPNSEMSFEDFKDMRK